MCKKTERSKTIICPYMNICSIYCIYNCIGYNYLLKISSLRRLFNMNTVFPTDTSLCIYKSSSDEFIRYHSLVLQHQNIYKQW